MPTKRLVSLTILLLSLAVPSCSDSAITNRAKVTGTWYWLIYIDGTNVGYQKDTRSKVTLNGQPANRTQNYAYMERASGRGMSIDLSLWTDASYAPIKAVMVTKSGGATTTVKVTWSKTEISFSETSDGKPPTNRTLKREPDDLMTEDQAWLKFMGDDGVKSGDTFKFHVLEIDVMKIVPVVWTSKGDAEKKLGSGAKVEGLKILEVRDGKRITMIVDDQGMPLFVDVYGKIELERTDGIPVRFKR